MKRVPYLLLSLAIILLDAWTKWVISARIDMHESISVIPNQVVNENTPSSLIPFTVGLVWALVVPWSGKLE